MPALQVRDFPEDLYEELKKCAEREHRSIAQQAAYILSRYLRLYRSVPGFDDGPVPVRFACANPALLESGAYEPFEPGTEGYFTEEDLARREVRQKRRRELLERIHSRPQTPVPEDFPSAVELIRQDRDGHAGSMPGDGRCSR